MKSILQESPAGTGVDINMSPLIDCVFLLLIFFVVTTVFVRPTAVEIDQPSSVSAGAVRDDVLQVALGVDGRVYVDGAELPFDSLRGLVARQAQGHELGVLLVADRRAQSGVLIRAIDECKLGGATRVHVAALPEERE